MAEITVTKAIDPSAIKAALGGVDVFTSGSDPLGAGEKRVIADVDEATLQAAIDGYAPPTDPDDEFRAAVETAVADEPAGSPLRKLAGVLLGTTAGPGAQPRRGRPAR